MNSKPSSSYRQAGAIPYRVVGNECEVLLITSRRRGRWIIPKGLIEPGMTPQAAAQQEAYEEAGVIGAASASPVGEFQYRKWGSVCVVQVFTLAVHTVLDTWPEATFRRRQWLSPERAAGLVKSAQLRALILDVMQARRLSA